MHKTRKSIDKQYLETVIKMDVDLLEAVNRLKYLFKNGKIFNDYSIMEILIDFWNKKSKCLEVKKNKN